MFLENPGNISILHIAYPYNYAVKILRILYMVQTILPIQQNG